MVPLKSFWLSRFRAALAAPRRRRRMRMNPMAMETMESRVLLTAAPLDHFITTDHVDLRSGYSSGAGWALGVHEDVQGHLSTDEAMHYVGLNTAVSRPGGAQYDFTGVAAGETFYIGSQTIVPGQLYLGASAYDVSSDDLGTINVVTESKGRVPSNGTGKWIQYSLVDVTHTNLDGSAGTGVFSVWQSGSFGQTTVWMSSHDDGVSNANPNGLDVTDGISADDAWWIQPGGHVHFNFGFSEVGRYEVQLALSGNINGEGVTTSEPFTVYFTVGGVGQVEFDADSYAVAEDGESATVTVRRVNGSDGQISVDYAITGGTATNGVDYEATNGTLVFLDGETEKQIIIPILDDAELEGDETITLQLSVPGPDTIEGFLNEFENKSLIGNQSSTTLTILDDDAVINDPPAALDDSYQVAANGQVFGNVLFNDSSNLDGELTATELTAPSKGTLTLNSDGSFVYTPGPEFDGADSFAYEVTDAGGTSSATVFLTASTGGNFIAGASRDHADVGLAFEDGEWDLHVHDEERELEYAADEILIQIGSASAAVVPDDPNYSFLGASAGTGIFILAAEPHPDLPYLGIATEEISEGTFEAGVQLRLKSVSGPGHVAIWSVDSFGAPVPQITTSNGIAADDFLTLPEGAHAHFHWGFTEAGRYEVTFEAVATLDGTGEEVRSGDITYHFAVNEGIPPEVTVAATAVKYSEQKAPTLIASTASLVDADSTRFGGGQVRIDLTEGGQPDDVLSIRHQGVSKNQIGIDGNQVTLGVASGDPIVIGTFEGGSAGEPLVIHLNANATTTTVRNLLRNVTFFNPSDNPTDETRIVRFVVADGSGAWSDPAIRQIEVTPKNDAPVIEGFEGTVNFVEDGAPVVIDGDATLFDADQPDHFLGGKLIAKITEGKYKFDRISVAAESGFSIDIETLSLQYDGEEIGTVASGAGTLAVTFTSELVTPELAQLLLQSLTFESATDANLPAAIGDRTISITLLDGQPSGKSVAATKTITVTPVNDAPELSGFDGATAAKYTENRPPVVIGNVGKAIDPDLLDFDGGTLTVSLAENGTSDDILGVRHIGFDAKRIGLVGSQITYGTDGFEANAMVIGTLTGGEAGTPLVVTFNANALAVHVTAVLKAITFQVNSENPSTLDRTVSFVLTDGDGATSNSATRTVQVIAQNDAPVLDAQNFGAGETVPWESGSPAALIADSASVTDVDSSDFVGGKLTVQVTTNRQSKDRIVIVEGNGITMDGSAVFYHGLEIGTFGGTTTLTITFTTSDADPAAVQALLRQIGFRADSDVATARTVRVILTDGDGGRSAFVEKFVQPTIAIA